MKVKGMDSKNQVLNETERSCSDQQVTEEVPLENILREYFCEEDLQSFYSDIFDVHAFDDLIVPDSTEMNADFLVPDSLSLDEFCQKYDDTEPEEQLFSLLEEYIQEEENGRKEKKAPETGDPEVACSTENSVNCQTNQPDVADSLVVRKDTTERRKTKKPGEKHSKRSQQLNQAEQPMVTRKKWRKDTC